MKLKQLPFIAYLDQCDCSEDNALGYLWESEKDLKKFACKESKITKVMVMKLIEIPPVTKYKPVLKYLTDKKEIEKASRKTFNKSNKK
jgi:hypothetical protein